METMFTTPVNTTDRGYVLAAEPFASAVSPTANGMLATS